LEYPIVLLEPLAFLLNRLLEQICARLASRALNTQELRLTLELQNLTGVDPQLDLVGIHSESDEAQSRRWSLAGLVGEARVGALELLDTHRAEGFRMKRLYPE
jgi:hypothetical protein